LNVTANDFEPNRKGAGLSDKRIENLIIIGSGPAGYTAALYAARAELEPLVIEGFQWGGQLQNTTDVENYPGYPEGIMGPEMMNEFRAQAERFGTRFITDDATEVELSDGGIQRVVVGKDEHLAKSVILSMGAEPKRLGVPGEQELGGRGVSTCGVCDGAFFKGEDVVVIGGGDSAMEDSIFVAKYAKKLTIVHRRDEFRASKIMLERARAADNIEFLTPYVVKEFVVGEDDKIAKVVLEQAETGEEKELEVGGAFIAIGHTPMSDLVKGQVDLDGGYVTVEEPSTKTNLAGVFAVGDLVDSTYRQAVTAAGTGCKGALDADAYLRDHPPSPEAHWFGQAGEVEKPAERAKVEAVEASSS
jgi:thioredoxin reductase (NADPH)